MNEVLNTLLACRNNSRLRDPLQAKIQKLKNTRICNCIIVILPVAKYLIFTWGAAFFSKSMPVFVFFGKKSPGSPGPKGDFSELDPTRATGSWIHILDLDRFINNKLGTNNTTRPDPTRLTRPKKRGRSAPLIQLDLITNHTPRIGSA